MSELARFVHPDFRLDVDGELIDLAMISARASRVAMPRGRVVVIPAGDALSVLVGLEAAWQAGSVPLPDARARTVSVLDEAPPASAALVLRTSGSTGVARMPWFEAGAVARSAQRIAAYLGLDRQDTVALLQPTDHGFGLIGQLLSAASVGARVAWCGRPFPNERAQAVARSGATIVAAVPFGLAQLSDHLPLVDARALARIRQVGSAGGPLAPDLARRLTAAFSGAIIWNQYGCTEAGPRIAAVPSTHAAFYTGTVGRPIDGVSVWIEGSSAPGDIGEICFVSDAAMSGYLGDPEATRRARRGDGFATGDLGIVDHDGRLHVVGRVDDVVKIRGEKVSLERVARAAEAAGAESAVALLADPSGQTGDAVLVVVYEGATEVRPAVLVRHLPPGVAPRRLLWVPALPRLGNGKIDRTTIEGLVRGETP